jgi:hypothetical protein
VTIRESEATRRVSRKADDLYELALEVLKDDPDATDKKLVSRMASQVESDDDLREQAIRAQCVHELRIARNHWQKLAAAGGKKKKEKQQRKKKDRDEQNALASKLVLKFAGQILGFIAENGKAIRDLNGYELVELRTHNGRRTALYDELCKRVKGEQIVGDVFKQEQEADWRKILPRLGDELDTLGRMFRS